MIQAQRLGHATFETPDLQRAVDYFVNVNGLDRKSTRLNSSH